MPDEFGGISLRLKIVKQRIRPEDSERDDLNDRPEEHAFQNIT